jgi:hypothetical protein
MYSRAFASSDATLPNAAAPGVTTVGCPHMRLIGLRGSVERPSPGSPHSKTPPGARRNGKSCRCLSAITLPLLSWGPDFSPVALLVSFIFFIRSSTRGRGVSSSSSSFSLPSSLSAAAAALHHFRGCCPCCSLAPRRYEQRLTSAEAGSHHAVAASPHAAVAVSQTLWWLR